MTHPGTASAVPPGDSPMTPPNRNPQQQQTVICAGDDCRNYAEIGRRLKEISGDTKSILERLGKGDVDFATLKLRLDFLERIVYGAVAVALLAVATAIVSMVVRSGPPDIKITLDSTSLQKMTEPGK